RRWNSAKSMFMLLTMTTSPAMRPPAASRDSVKLDDLDAVRGRGGEHRGLDTGRAPVAVGDALAEVGHRVFGDQVHRAPAEATARHASAETARAGRGRLDHRVELG